MELKKTFIDSESAYAFLDEWAFLALGHAEALRGTVRAEGFVPWTLSHMDVPAAQARDFRTARPILRVSAAEVVGAAVTGYMEPADTWVVPDPVGDPTGRAYGDTAAPYVILDGGVYFFTSEPDAAKVTQAWGWGSSAMGQIGFVSSAWTPTADGLCGSHSAAIAAVKLVVMSAYDGLGCVFFDRSSEERQGNDAP